MFLRFLPGLLAIVAAIGLAKMFSPESGNKPSVSPSDEARISKIAETWSLHE